MLAIAYKIRYLRSILECFFGTLEARYLHDVHLNTSGSIERGLNNILNRWGDSLTLSSEFSPVFIFSAGWRSGSTLVQRLVFSSGKYFIWGEPYGGAGIIENLAEQFSAFGEIWPVESNFLSNFLSKEQVINNAYTKWIANLTPDIQDLISSHRKFLETLFYDPIKSHYRQWGLKEVRLGYEHALYLSFLYPKAKFIFLVRNPLEAYRSYKRFRRWYVRIPKEPVFTPYSFARHWNRLAKGFWEGKDRVSAILLKYEDLVNHPDKTLRILEKHLSLSIKRDVLQRKVGSSSPNAIKLTILETIIIKFICKHTASLLGYQF